MQFREEPYNTPVIPHQDYEERVVAFIDILGFSDLVAHSSGNIHSLCRLTSALDAFYNLLWEYEADGIKSSFAFTQFSDSIVVSALADSKDSFEMVQQLLRGIILLAFDYGIFVRGGIAKGQLIHDETMLVGPAMVEAYRLESKAAIYPRVILSEELKLEFDEGVAKYIENYTTLEGIPAQNFIFSKDEDGWWYLDYIKPPFEFINISRCIQSMEEYRCRLQEIASTRIQSDDMRVKAKYRWLDRVLSEKYNKIDTNQ